MELGEAIRGRRSIRFFKTDEIPMNLVKEIIEAATWAPSTKNGQQWRFTVLTGDSKKRFCDMFGKQMKKMREEYGEGFVGSALDSLGIMEEAPVTVIIWNAGEFGWGTEAHSVAAAIQNMLLKAHSLGLGSLWIGDVLYADEEIPEYFNKNWILVAAVALGWAKEYPDPPSRMSVDELTEFLS
ncbi:MAG: nitroreductase family protein [Candidatus Thorarchaeota archaeon]